MSRSRVRPGPAGGDRRAGAGRPSRGGAQPSGKSGAPTPRGREAPSRGPAPAVRLADPSTGRAIVVASFVGTALLAVTTLLAVVAPHVLDLPALVVALAMFFAGMAAFAWAYVVAIGRSRESELSLAGVFGLAGSTPSPVRIRLLGSLAVEVAVALGGAAIRPSTSLSFGILAPMWGLGTVGLWGARHGAFPPRADTGRGRPTASSGSR